MKRRSSALALTALVAATRVATAQPRPAPRAPAAIEMIDVTVRAGDTCASITRRQYRNTPRTDVIHQYNPGVCPPQRALVVGAVLHLPRRLPALRGPVAPAA